MTWEIVVGLIMLVSIALSLGGVLAKLVQTLTRLDVTIKTMEKSVADLSEKNTESHRRIWGAIDDHEHRIDAIESHDTKPREPKRKTKR